MVFGSINYLWDCCCAEMMLAKDLVLEVSEVRANSN